MKHRIVSIFASLALVVAFAAPVAAYTTDETLSVTASITVTGIPASVAYGSAAAGATTGFGLDHDISVTSNAPWNLVVTQTDFTANGNTIAKSARLMKFGSPTGVTIAAAVNDTFVGGSNAVWASPVITGTVGASSFHAMSYVSVPADAKAGNYTGSIDWNFSANL